MDFMEPDFDDFTRFGAGSRFQISFRLDINLVCMTIIQILIEKCKLRRIIKDFKKTTNLERIRTSKS